MRPLAKALTLRPGAATGVRPPDQPRAVGILSVGKLPCGLAGGIAGRAPKACGPEAVCSRRRMAVAPTMATPRAMISDSPMARSLPFRARI